MGKGGASLSTVDPVASRTSGGVCTAPRTAPPISPTHPPTQPQPANLWEQPCRIRRQAHPPTTLHHTAPSQPVRGTPQAAPPHKLSGPNQPCHCSQEGGRQGRARSGVGVEGRGSSGRAGCEGSAHGVRDAVKRQLPPTPAQCSQPHTPERRTGGRLHQIRCPLSPATLPPPPEGRPRCSLHRRLRLIHLQAQPGQHLRRFRCLIDSSFSIDSSV